jgi:hypothetical protein
MVLNNYNRIRQDIQDIVQEEYTKLMNDQAAAQYKTSHRQDALSPFV